MALETLLQRFGLTTRERLEQALTKKEVWHGLVRDVFARYYLKLREPFPAQLPDLPRRYSPEWDRFMREELDNFLRLDLHSVGQLLDACGFGTEKWERFRREALPHLDQIVESYLSGSGGNGQPAPALPPSPSELEAELESARVEIRKLRSGGRRALEQIRDYEHQIEALRQRLEEAGEVSPAMGGENGAERAPADLLVRDPEREREIEELRQQVAARDHTIAALTNRLEDLESDMEIATPTRSADAEEDDEDSLVRGASASSEADLLRRNQELEKALRAKEHTISTLRAQIEEFEEQMGTAREQLLGEVRRLSDLASGAVQLKPSAELDTMGADELLDYAQEVATDLDVRRQTLDEGLQGIESLRDNYEESRHLYEDQQQKLQEQIEKMSAELQAYQERREEEGEDAEGADGEQVVNAQRHQLQLLGSRIKELSDANKNLNETNQKIYRDLDTAVKRLIPLRRQIEELESLRDALTQYIRQKYDRAFTTRKLKE